MISKAISIAAAIWCSSAISASAITYKCEMDNHARNGTVPETIFVSIDDQTGDAAVLDQNIKYVYKEPIRADIRQMGKNKYELVWVVKNLPLRGNSKADMRVVLRLDVARKSVSYLAFLGGFANQDRGSGKCERYKGA